MANIFVFGSNLAGRHGAGSALHAMKHHGAVYGRSFGSMGTSFGIPTKDENLHVLPLSRIQAYVNDFICYALDHPEDTFNVVAIGCGLAGYEPYQIGPMFMGAPLNVKLPEEFERYR